MTTTDNEYINISDGDCVDNVIVYEAKESWTRLDVFVAYALESKPGFTRSMAKKLIDSGKVLVNGSRVKAGTSIRLHDIIEISLTEPDVCDVLPEDIPLDIVYEDESIAVINKPKGMVVHPAPGNSTGTLVNALMFHIKDLSGIGGIKRPGIVHRIDKLTSGLLVIAKNDAAHISLCEQIKQHSARRTYIALVCGNIKQDSGTVDIAIGRHPVDRKKMTVKPVNSQGLFRDAITHFKVLERFSQYTLVEATLETGRTHQIRVHMAYIKHPVVGDTVYSSGKNPFGFDGQALHAINLELTHPVTGMRMKFCAPLPDYFCNALTKLGSAFDLSSYSESDSILKEDRI